METASSEPLPLMETVQQPESDVFPLMETVSHALTTPEEAMAHAAIFGFTPEEALADAHFQINMLQANNDELEDRHDSAKRDKRKLEAEIENLRRDISFCVEKRGETETELEEVKADRAKLLESSITIKVKLEKEVQQLRSQLATERADREEVEEKLSEEKQNSVTASQELPEAADLLNQLKAKRRKSTATLADVEAILGMIEKS
jgi:predicted ribosome quality control (RQC) complex YloA/Tae2 family protein